MAKSPPRSTKKATNKVARAKPNERARDNESTELLTRIASALERLAPSPPPAPDFAAAEAFVWYPEGQRLAAVRRVNRVDMSLLKVIEIHREDIETLPELMGLLRNVPQRFIVFCDDLSFDAEDTSYKSLKTMLEGGIEGRPENVIFYATSNRRHLMARDMMENERATAINPGEAVEEKVSLSDRFGLWLGFHRCSQDEYLDMVAGYVGYYRIPMNGEKLRAEALEWATTRGSRSGRVAWQYVQDLAGRLKVPLEEPAAPR